MKENIGILCALFSGLTFGLLGLFGVQILQYNYTVPNMLFWRFFVCFLFMTILIFVKREKWKILPREILLGFSAYGPSSLVYFYASRYLGTGVAMVIFFTFPAMVLVLNKIFFKLKIGPLYYLAVGFIFIGLALQVDRSELSFDVLGIVLSLISALLYACYIVVSKKKNNQIAKNYSPILSTSMVAFGCLLINFIVALIEGPFMIPDKMEIWIPVLSMGIISTALPLVLFLYGLKYISSEKASILAVLEPVFVVLAGVLFLGEKISTSQAVGITIILSGALLSLRI